MDNERVTGTVEHDTIAAISTPPGRGGIGIVRLSGPEARSIALRLVRLAGELQVRRPHRAEVLHPDDPGGNAIDDALVTAFIAPQSYTGEDVVEIAAHGSPVILQALVTGALRHGARLARPGEFTERAFLSGRLDLTEAEAVNDLIAAQTLQQARTAASQLGGALSRRVKPAKEQLLHLIALLEAGMDFASGELDDVDVVQAGVIATSLGEILAPLIALAASFQGGQLLRSGAALALVGRPNAGKSSLFNRLLLRERAIVTPQPGTTRDTVEETLALNGVPLRLVDTAGLRLAEEAPADLAEVQGIARSQEALADADLVLVVFDSSLPLTAEELAHARGLTGRPHVLVGNKVDLLSEPARMGIIQQLRRDMGGAKAIFTSALTGEGLEDLKAAILDALNAPGALASDGALNTMRQHEAVSAAIAGLHAAIAATSAGIPHEMLLLDLHAALHSLDQLTGETTTEDILGRIFSTFCIGK